jgi:hypothetical protein
MNMPSALPTTSIGLIAFMVIAFGFALKHSRDWGTVIIQ